jgi:hypothetical protein
MSYRQLEIYVSGREKKEKREFQKLAWAVACIINPHVKGNITPKRLAPSAFKKEFQEDDIAPTSFQEARQRIKDREEREYWESKEGKKLARVLEALENEEDG